jgi:ribonucleoside-diphosphate reductase alpha chain
MLVVDFGLPGIVDAAREIATERSLRHLNLAINVEDSVLQTSLSKEVDARSQIDSLVSCALESGNPGFVFSDRVNLDRCTPQRITACNACAEQHLLPNEGVPLASLNLAHFVDRGRFDFAKLDYAAALAVRLLDDAIDASEYPSEESERVSRAFRRIGVGVMGLDTTLRQIGAPYDTDEAVELSERLASVLRNATQAASNILAIERGAFPAFDPTTSELGRRNACLRSIAPTGGISSLWGVSSGIEPLFGSRVVKEHQTIRVDVGDGTVPLREPHEIPWAWHIRHLAAWQAHVDGGISKTVNVPKTTSSRDAFNLLHAAWKSRTKSVSIFRNGSRPGGLRSA